MADVCCTYSFGSLVINPSEGGSGSDQGDRLELIEDGILGLDGRPIRRQRDPASRTDGSLVFGANYAGRVITVRAVVVIGTVGHDGGPTVEYLSAYNAFEDAVIAALEAQLNTPTNLAWTPTGGSPKTVSCVYGTEDGEVQFTGPQMNRLCSFTLLEALEIID